MSLFVFQIQPVVVNASDGSGFPSGMGSFASGVIGTGSGSSSGLGTAGSSSTGVSGSSSSSSSAQSTAPRYCLRLRANLCGHTEAVTCLAASHAFNLVVSGSRDRTCILWDLTRLCFLRQLVGHTAPVAAVTISEATGDIATCGGTYLYLWNCNGDPIARVDALAGRNKQILCVSMSTVGCSRQTTRFWSSFFLARTEFDVELARPLTNFSSARRGMLTEFIVSINFACLFSISAQKLQSGLFIAGMTERGNTVADGLHTHTHISLMANICYYPLV